MLYQHYEKNGHSPDSYYSVIHTTALMSSVLHVVVQYTATYRSKMSQVLQNHGK